MFKRKKKNEESQVLTDQLNQDLIVHNMPALSRLSGIFADKSSVPSSPVSPESVTGAKKNFKIVGLIIMAGGLVFIGLLVYLSYIFIIKPAALQNQPVAAVSPAPVSQTATATPVISPIVATTTDLATVTPVAIDLATTTATSTVDFGGAATSSVIDSDQDGLNDLEEAILGTAATSTDSDNDGYSDYAEVISGYNPLGAGKISADANLAAYTNKTFNFSILYSKTWPTQSLNQDAATIFTAPDNSLIQVTVQDNPNQSNILTWYEQNFPQSTVTYDKVRSTYSWEGIMGDDGLNFYLTDKNFKHIFVISYISAADGRVAYPTIFQLMINSLFIK
jgi:hypothetical protein